MDDDPNSYTEQVLQEWKMRAEESTRKAIKEGPQPKQATRSKTFRPRLDAYTRFIDALLRRPLDHQAQREVIAQLGLVQLYSSDDVRAKAHELFEYAEDFRRNNRGNIPRNIIERVDAELQLIIIEEIERITSEENQRNSPIAFQKS